MGGIDKLAWTVAGRPLLAYTLDGLAAGPRGRVDRRGHVRRPARRAGGRTVAAVEGPGRGRRRSPSPGFGGRRVRGPRIGDPGCRREPRRPGPRWRTPGRASRAGRRRGRGVASVRGGHPDRAGRRDHQAPRRRRDHRDRGPCHAGCRPDAAGGAPRGVATAAADPIAATGTWTDEAALLEACRIAVHAVPGDPTNLKVTMPDDLARAATLLAPDGPAVRSGIGHDAHPFGPGAPLMLGGIAIAGAPRLLGHSDGDVAIHAVADALLGAAALGDLGRHFPAGPRNAGGHRESRAPRRSSCERLTAAGWRPATIDLTIDRGAAAARRPARRDARGDRRHAGRRRRPASASRRRTGNLDGSEGAGRSISALAIATIERRSHDHPTAGHADRRDPAVRAACATSSASTRAARRCTARPTSATSARSCSPTCSSATCAGAGTWSAGS